jgi:DNA methylase
VNRHFGKLRVAPFWLAGGIDLKWVCTWSIRAAVEAVGLRLARREQDGEGRLHFPAKPTGQLRLKMYLDASPNPLLQNLWDDIYPINSQAMESLGYPTQKPLPLLERIIKASSNENDIVWMHFAAAGRRWWRRRT